MEFLSGTIPRMGGSAGKNHNVRKDTGVNDAARDGPAGQPADSESVFDFDEDFGSAAPRQKQAGSQFAARRRYVLDRLHQYALLVRLHRPIGILLLLWPTLWALWIAASGKPDTGILIIFIAGVILTRSAGCAINDYADRDFDPGVERTKERPIAAGTVTPVEALGVCVVLASFALILALQLNVLTLSFAVAGALLAATYPFAKRFHYLPQVHLGLAFSWGIPMAFTAQTGAWPGPIAWLLFLAGVMWAVVYDTEYAMVDREDDIRLGIKSSAILFGDMDWVIIGLLQGLVMCALLMVGWQAELGPAYFVLVIAAAGVFFHQQQLIRTGHPAACLYAFISNNWFGLMVFIGIVLSFLLQRTRLF
ncbi:MAG: 4-hydroxybenzoate octaprenyltransferase [Gammaproteobacteria bacterium]